MMRLTVVIVLGSIASILKVECCVPKKAENDEGPLKDFVETYVPHKLMNSPFPDVEFIEQPWVVHELKNVNGSAEIRWCDYCKRGNSDIQNLKASRQRRTFDRLIGRHGGCETMPAGSNRRPEGRGPKKNEIPKEDARNNTKKQDENLHVTNAFAITKIIFIIPNGAGKIVPNEPSSTQASVENTTPKDREETTRKIRTTVQSRDTETRKTTPIRTSSTNTPEIIEFSKGPSPFTSSTTMEGLQTTRPSTAPTEEATTPSPPRMSKNTAKYFNIEIDGPPRRIEVEIEDMLH